MNKVFSKLMIIDGSYLLQRSLHVEELWDLRNKSGERSGGIYGFLKSLDHEFKNMDYYPVVTWDAGLSPRRTSVYDKYKKHNMRVAERILKSDKGMSDSDLESRLASESISSDSIRETMESIHEIMRSDRAQSFATYDPDDYRVQYHRQRDVLINILNSLGVPSIRISGWEGDDLMTLLKRMSYRSVVMTDDRDLIQLLSPETDIWRPMNKKKLKYDSYLSEMGYDDIREMVIIKAIVGDSSDNIPSVTSGLERKFVLGSKRAEAVAKIILKNNEDPVKYLPELESYDKNYYRGFIMNHDNFLRNMKLVDLSLVENDEDVMKVMMAEILSKAGKCNMMTSAQLIGEQDITSFDLNGFISKMNVLSCGVRYQEGGTYNG